MVHGLLWTVPDHDVPALDAYEEVETGLYRKAAISVVRRDAGTARALIYLGRSRTTGPARRGYLEAVIAAAVSSGLPGAYLDELRRWLPATTR